MQNINDNCHYKQHETGTAVNPQTCNREVLGLSHERNPYVA
jgi:hypothetical protein